MNRTLTDIQNSEPVTDGDGVKINRNLAGKSLAKFDPFLLLDEIYSDDPEAYIGGFPEHPHRGFETVTYMLEGSMKHRDHMGNEGILKPGSVQWMTAGRGVLHSEMPMQEEGLLHGFQLWVNLPAAEKMQAPAYKEFAKESVPVAAIGKGSHAKIIAGSFNSQTDVITGPITDVTVQPDYFDIHLCKGDCAKITSEQHKRVLLYVYEGSVLVDGKQLNAQQLGMLSEGNILEITASKDSRLLYLAGFPIKEPIANWGPFVMNTHEEIEQAITDYRNGKLA